MDGTTINAEDFKTRHVISESDGFAFYLDYYFHLLIDIAWSKLFDKRKLEPIYYEGLGADPSFIWTIKKDWYGQDEVYLQSNPDSAFFRIFRQIESFDKVNFDYYPHCAFTRQIHYITNRYLTAKANPDRDYPFLSKGEMDSLVNETIVSLQKIRQQPRTVVG